MFPFLIPYLLSTSMFQHEARQGLFPVRPRCAMTGSGLRLALAAAPVPEHQAHRFFVFLFFLGASSPGRIVS